MDNVTTARRRIAPQEYDVFIGMDVDKRSIAVTHVDHLGVEKSIEMPYDAGMLLGFVRNHFDGKRVAFAYEAGPTGFGLYDDIVSSGQDCLVVSAASVPTPRNRRVRTNRLDSRKLAYQLRGGALSGIRVPSEVYRMLRELVALRQQYVSEVRANKCRIKAVFLRNGLPFEWSTPGGYWSSEVIQCLREYAVADVLSLKINKLVDGLVFAQYQASEVQRSIREFVQSNLELGESVRLLMSIPGIGWIVATYALARVGDWRKLGRSHEMASFFGLVPSEDSTGEGADRGSITKAGDPRMRSLLIQAAWSAIRKDDELNEFYQRIYNSHGKNVAARVAITAVARKLTARMHCVLKERREYVVRADSQKPSRSGG